MRIALSILSLLSILHVGCSQGHHRKWADEILELQGVYTASSHFLSDRDRWPTSISELNTFSGMQFSERISIFSSANDGKSRSDFLLFYELPTNEILVMRRGGIYSGRLE